MTIWRVKIWYFSAFSTDLFYKEKPTMKQVVEQLKILGAKDINAMRWEYRGMIEALESRRMPKLGSRLRTKDGPCIQLTQETLL